MPFHGEEEIHTAHHEPAEDREGPEMDFENEAPFDYDLGDMRVETPVSVRADAETQTNPIMEPAPPPPPPVINKDKEGEAGPDQIAVEKIAGILSTHNGKIIALCIRYANSDKHSKSVKFVELELQKTSLLFL